MVSADEENVLKGNLLQYVMIFLPTMLIRQICKLLPVIKKPRKSLTRQAQGPGVVNARDILPYLVCAVFHVSMMYLLTGVSLREQQAYGFCTYLCLCLAVHWSQTTQLLQCFLKQPPQPCLRTVEIMAFASNRPFLIKIKDSEVSIAGTREDSKISNQHGRRMVTWGTYSMDLHYGDYESSL